MPPSMMGVRRSPCKEPSCIVIFTHDDDDDDDMCVSLSSSSPILPSLQIPPAIIPPHILTRSHFSPFHPSPSSQAPPSSYPPPRYIYTSMPSLCVLYTLGCQSFLQPIPCPQAALVQSQPNCRSKPQLFAITDNIPARTIFPRRNDPEPDNLCASYKPSITIGPPTRCRENTHTQNYYLTSSRLFCRIIIHPLDQYPQQPDPEPPLSTAS